MSTELLDQLLESIRGMTPAERAAAEKEAAEATTAWRWTPTPGPQMDACFCEADELFYGGQAGGGKGLRPHSHVLTPFGWREIGSLKVGDALCATDGTVTKVIATFHRGTQPLYRLTFADGTSIECDADHIWVASGRKWSTTQIADLYAGDGRLIIPRYLREGVPLDSIERCGDGETVCIAVDHPNSLFVTDHLLVTHNTSLGIGLSLTQHKRSLILRRVGKDARKLVADYVTIVGSRVGFNGQDSRWVGGAIGDGRQIDIGGCESDDDKQRYKGDPHDLYYFDEGTDFLYSQYRFITGWNRSPDPKQRCRIVVGSNPPTTAEGLWVIKHWSPWLDPMHPNPALPGELRWFTAGPDGEDMEVEGKGPHLVNGEEVYARSRTYLPAKLSDNPDQRGPAYAAVLAGLPPELRAAYRDGDFSAGLKDNPNQVIQTSWIEAAQARWKPQAPRQPLTAIAVDVAQGGDDFTVLAKRYGGWYAELVRKPGKETKSGIEIAQMVVAERTNRCPVIIDAGGGYGGDAASKLGLQGIPVVSFLGQGSTLGTSRNGMYKFYNKRAETWWRMREELDPEQEFGSAVSLPPGAQIKADLAAPTWELTTRGIKIEDKADIKKRLGRSPDDGDAIVLCMSEGAKAAAKQAREDFRGARPERAGVGHSAMKDKFR